MSKLKHIIFHWTAGSYNPNATDLEHYHYIINAQGVVKTGKYKPEDNEDCKDGKYAAHAGGYNTGSIGISFCGMAGFSNRNKVGKYPLTKAQVEAGFKLAAELCKKYGMDPKSAETIQTHYGVGRRNPKTSSGGKIDIVYLPPYPEVSQEDVESFIRRKVCWYYSKL